MIMLSKVVLFLWEIANAMNWEIDLCHSPLKKKKSPITKTISYAQVKIKVFFWLIKLKIVLSLLRFTT